ncbi:MAG: ROK family transcriptional regulator [Eubacteriales bacterium]|nr:ROK family transcriptional regulator [Eubacteriales bacterium]
MTDKSTNVIRNNKMVKDENVSSVLQLIREHPLISRVEISKKLNLSTPTVLRIVAEILDLGLLECTGVGESSGGRKPVLYSIKKDAGEILGVDITKERVKIGVFNFAGEKLNEYKRECPNRADFFHFLVDFLTEVIAEQKNDKIMGIGVGMSGNVIHESGVVKYSNVFDFQDVPFKELLKSHLKYPVFLEERVHCAALAGKLMDSSFSNCDIIYMYVGSSIGAGIIIDGKIHYGRGNSISGEVGHMILEKDGPVCACGSRGCLEQLASESAIVRNVAKELENGRSSTVRDAINGDSKKLTGDLIAEAAEKGDALCYEALDKACQYLAIVVVNLLMLFNPTKLVITNAICKSDELIERLLFKNLAEISSKQFIWKEMVVFERDKDRILKGCALLVMEKVLENPKLY